MPALSVDGGVGVGGAAEAVGIGSEGLSGGRKLMLTDFDRGLGYGLVVTLACSVGAYWLGQDHAPEPGISSEWIPSCSPNESDAVNATQIAAAETCTITDEAIECRTDDITSTSASP
jgi:hypothetical protein